MINKNIYTISESFSLENNNKLLNNKNIFINNIIVKDDASSAKALLDVSKNADLIIIVDCNFSTIAKTIKAVNDIIAPIIYCSINNLEIQNNKNSIISFVPYVIHGYKEQTNNILLKTIEKILQ
jgi:GH25 family lysozyme M1 (1,4-beta-N-acetylmuramidase)